VIDYRTLVRLAWGGFGLAILMLLVARLLGSTGDETYGVTSRAISIAGWRLQPSELAKVMVILVLGRVFSDSEPTLYTPRSLVIRLGCFLIPIFLIAIQPDLGTAVLLTLIVLTVGYLAMPNVWPMVYLTTAGLLAIPIFWEKLHGYQKERITAFVDCSTAPTKLCWHTQQSIYAVGSGKIWGKGLLGGT